MRAKERPARFDPQTRSGLVPLVVVVGAGFSGTLVVLRTLDITDHDVDILVLEKDPRNLYGGLAFGETGAGWEHLLNIQAGRVSMFREEPDDFLCWANGGATAKAGWPAEWQDYRFTPSSPVPRLVYAQYLRDRLAIVAARRPRSSIRTVRGEAVAVTPVPDGVVISYSTDGMPYEVHANAAILATGHWEPLIPAALRELQHSDERLIVDPYSTHGRRRLLATPRDAKVLIVGTGLTSFDVIMTLQSSGHRGAITCLSRHGFQHRPYPPDHLHDIPALTERARFLDVSANSPDTFLSTFMRDFARIRHGLSDLPVMVRDERAWKALEPAIAEFCASAPPELVRELLRRFKSAMVTSRIGTVQQIINPIAELLQSGHLIKEIGEIADVAADGASMIVTITGAEPEARNVQADRIVLACGRITDLGAVSDPLWTGLRLSALAEAEPVTGLGVAADEDGRLACTGSIDRLFAIGPMRQGSELVRHGRTGAFVFSIGTLRNQAHHTALAVAQLIRRLHLGAENAGVPSPGEVGSCTLEAIRAVQLRVGYPMTRPVDGAQRETEAISHADLATLELLEGQAVGALTDISKLAPEIEERVALQRSIKSSLRLTGTKGRTPMNQITVQLNREGATATRTKVRDHHVVIDRPTANDGTDAGPMGGELFLVSIGGCFMSTFIAAAKAQSIAADAASCEVIGTLADDIPRRFASVELAVSCDQCAPDDLEHLVRVAEEGCLVVNTLRGNLDLKVSAK